MGLESPFRTGTAEIAHGVTGAEFVRLVLSLPREEQKLDAGTLLDIYEGRLCRDCGLVHDTVWAALACDDYTDARRRSRARRAIRNRLPEEPEEIPA